MANTFTSVVDTIFARSMVALRQNAIMARLVNIDWSAEVAQQGDTINVPMPSAMTVGDVTPGPTPPAGQNVAPTTTAIQLNYHRATEMHLTDKEAREIAIGAKDVQLSEAMKALTNDVDAKILALYKDIYGWAGTAGTTPFASDLSAATDARKVLGDQLAPMDPRRIVMGTAAEANALLLRAVQDASFRANNANALATGQIGSLLGFDWFVDQLVPSHTAGTITTGLIAKAATAQAIGDKTIVCTTAASTGACALKAGDIITFAGQSQTYVVTADATQASAASDVTVNIEPGLVVALAGSEAVTVKANHVANIAFHRDAFALAVRPLGAADGFSGGNEIRTGVDPISGLAMTLEVSREYMRTKYQWSILYGVKTMRRELACRIAG